MDKFNVALDGDNPLLIDIVRGELWIQDLNYNTIKVPLSRVQEVADYLVLMASPVGDYYCDR